MGRRHAVVVGASMAGLLAARVLAETFAVVTVVDRDELPHDAAPRRGVPQGRHTHGLLGGGGQALELLFPGISEELMSAGAVAGDLVRDARWFFEGACLSRPASGLVGLLMSRPLLEHAVRMRVRALPNVRLWTSRAVTDLDVDLSRTRVVGVHCEGESVAADLVVDATGRASHTPQWLDRLGFPAPVEERVEVALAYTTRRFARDARALGGDISVVIPPTPEGKQGGVMLAQEGRRWTVTLIAHFGPAAPDDLDGFLEFAAGLPSRDIYDVIRHAEPIGEPASARFPASVRRRYEGLRRFPEGYVVIGDGISSFNPIYGQGMSVAALEALELRSALAEGDGQLARRFFARAAKVVDIPWSIAVGNDLRMPEAVGKRTPLVRAVNWYMAKLHRAAQQDPELSIAFHRVANLLASPPSLMHLRVATRVLRHGLQRAWAPPAAYSVAESMQAGGRATSRKAIETASDGLSGGRQA